MPLAVRTLMASAGPLTSGPHQAWPVVPVTATAALLAAGPPRCWQPLATSRTALRSRPGSKRRCEPDSGAEPTRTGSSASAIKSVTDGVSDPADGKIATHATASAATASAAASHWTGRGAGLLAVRKTPQMPMKPKTAIWMVCQPRAEADSPSSCSAGAGADRGALDSSGSINPIYPKVMQVIDEVRLDPEPSDHLHISLEGRPGRRTDLSGWYRCPLPSLATWLIMAAAASAWCAQLEVSWSTRHLAP